MRLLDRFQAGDSQAAPEIFDRYVARLIGLARSRLSQGLKRRIDPEDVVHSAYRSFFVHAAEGDFALEQSGDLWRLLAQITLNKLRKQAERHTAARRDFRRDEGDAKAAFQASAEPAPEEAAALIEQVRLVAERLSADERFVLSAYLRGDSVDMIAKRLAKSPRTVRRALARVRTQTERQLLGSGECCEVSVDETPLEYPIPYSDFRLERLIGAGGMGKVYLATQQSTGEVVAVKALRKVRQTDNRAVKQFLHEAAVVERMDHPGVIRVRGLGRFPTGGYFIVMDLIDGGDLQTLIDTQRLPLTAAVAILERVAEAIVHAHQAGVVHCDLKPANILLGRDQRVVVTDFGFAQIIAGERAPAALGGTLGYLAPELLERRGRPTPAADVYSLGRILERIVDSEQSSLR
ncbi:protein kinase domain-containing protein [Botrimarina colliarenosi]|nr:protein kinase [Botrimarina colliarenosi]